jgi:hypothetical protein
MAKPAVLLELCPADRQLLAGSLSFEACGLDGP